MVTELPPGGGPADSATRSAGPVSRQTGDHGWAAAFRGTQPGAAVVPPGCLACRGRVVPGSGRPARPADPRPPVGPPGGFASTPRRWWVAGWGALPSPGVAWPAVPDTEARPPPTTPIAGCHATGCGPVPDPVTRTNLRHDQRDRDVSCTPAARVPFPLIMGCPGPVPVGRAFHSRGGITVEGRDPAHHPTRPPPTDPRAGGLGVVDAGVGGAAPTRPPGPTSPRRQDTNCRLSRDAPKAMNTRYHGSYSSRSRVPRIMRHDPARRPGHQRRTP
jgi:hypothetical protein